MRVDAKPQYGYGTAPENGGGYGLKDRPVSSVLHDRVLNPLAALPSGARVLDIGSGDGNLALKAGPKRPYKIVAVDLEADAVRIVNNIFAEQGRSQIDVAVVGNATRLHEVSELNGSQVDAAVSWRVLHGIPGHLQLDVLRQAHDRLKPGRSLYLAVASDQDWKVEALGDDFLPGQTNDCKGVMFLDHGVERKNPFPILFFSEERLTDLAQRAGFYVGDKELFTEPSGYDHLKGQPNTYLFAELVKPLNAEALVRSRASDATTLVDFTRS